MHKAQVYRNVEFVGEGHRDLTQRSFEMAIVRVEAENGFELRIAGRVFTDSKRYEGEWPIAVARSDSLEVSAKGRWRLFTHVAREVDYRPRDGGDFAGLVPFPSADGQVVDCMPYSYGRNSDEWTTATSHQNEAVRSTIDELSKLSGKKK